MSRKLILIAALSIGLGLALHAGANASDGRVAKGEAKPAAAAELIEGEVRRIDKAAGTATIKHGAMPKFDMPPMTMSYRIKDKAMLNELKPGDKIRFDVDGVGGAFTVTRLEKVK